MICLESTNFLKIGQPRGFADLKTTSMLNYWTQRRGVIKLQRQLILCTLMRYVAANRGLYKNNLLRNETFAGFMKSKLGKWYGNKKTFKFPATFFVHQFVISTTKFRWKTRTQQNNLKVFSPSPQRAGRWFLRKRFEVQQLANPRSFLRLVCKSGISLGNYRLTLLSLLP